MRSGRSGFALLGHLHTGLLSRQRGRGGRPPLPSTHPPAPTRGPIRTDPVRNIP
ncbi:hypothetical protein [Lysobacter gummosus]|uniref:hypothetical protein n=1 Tax=Lysobacter gummosus TaxID=262324 RepID=UPI0036322B24